jgi:histidyl-tRNA synthetase
VGISFGADRIEDVLEHFDKFPTFLDKTTDVLVTQTDASDVNAELLLVTALRKSGLTVELYPDPAKLKKQMKYADDRSIPYLVMFNPESRNQGSAILKQMDSGDQWEIAVSEIAEKVKNL